MNSRQKMNAILLSIFLVVNSGAPAWALKIRSTGQTRLPGRGIHVALTHPAVPLGKGMPPLAFRGLPAQTAWRQLQAPALADILGGNPEQARWNGAALFEGAQPPASSSEANQDSAAAAGPLPNDAESLLALREEWRQKRRSLETRRGALIDRLNAHNFHALTDSKRAAIHHKLANEVRLNIGKFDSQLATADKWLAAIEAGLTGKKASSRKGGLRFEVQGSQAALQTTSASGTKFPIPLSGKPKKLTPQQKAERERQSLVLRFKSRGFDVKWEKQSAKIKGRWSGLELDLKLFGLVLATTPEGELSSSRGSETLDFEKTVAWLEAVEMASAELPAAPKFEEPTEQEAVEAGRKLYSWGVPPHIINNSQKIKQKIDSSGRKKQVTLTPDIPLYSFKQGVPVATWEGVILSRMLEEFERKAKEDERQGKRNVRRPSDITTEELNALGEDLKKDDDEGVLAWAKASPEDFSAVVKGIYEEFISGELVPPLMRDLAGIDLSRAAFDLAGYLSRNFSKLQEELRAAVKEAASVEKLQELAQAARFAFTALSLSGDEDPDETALTILHRDGLSFLKRTKWESSDYILALLPLGQTIRYLGWEPVLRYIQDNDIKWAKSLALADAGVADITHADLAKNVVDINRAGDRLHEIDLLEAGDEEDSSEEPEDEDSAKKDSRKKKKSRLKRKIKKEEPPPALATRGEHFRIDSHATAVATPMALAAELLGSKVISMDLPGFEGDRDTVPGGVNFDFYFAEELMRAFTAAQEKWGVWVVNNSWGGNMESRAHAYIDELHDKKGVVTTHAFGNSGPGKYQQTAPAYADSIFSVGGEDQLGREASFTSGGGPVKTVKGRVVRRPHIVFPAGYYVADGEVDHIEGNADTSSDYLPGSLGRYVHIRGTSFSDPLATATLHLLGGVAVFEVRKILGAQGLNGQEQEQFLDRIKVELADLVVQSLLETAEKLPGVRSRYQGRGRARVAKAFPWVIEKVKALLSARPAA